MFNLLSSAHQNKNEIPADEIFISSIEGFWYGSVLRRTRSREPIKIRREQDLFFEILRITLRGDGSCQRFASGSIDVLVYETVSCSLASNGSENILKFNGKNI